MRIISPSILSADFSRLESETKMLNESSAEWIHIDIMDGVFVPNISFGFPILEAIRKHTTKVLDVHLMIVEPEKYIERFAKAGADIIVYHFEATDNHTAIINQIKECGIKAGVSIKPNTPVEVLQELLPLLDVVLIMGVEPGFGGQAIFDNTFERTQELKELIAKLGAKTTIEIDGGVNNKNAAALFKAGANALVAGSAVFSSNDPKRTIEELLNI